MNPLPIVFATVRRNLGTFVLFVIVVSIAVAIGVALTAEERAVRLASARAADKFDLIVAAPGSQTDAVLTAIYLRPGTIPLMTPNAVAKIFAEQRLAFAAPIAFGDSYRGAPIVGSITALVEHLSNGLAEGRMFSVETEAVVGAASPLSVGNSFRPTHGLHPGGGDDGHHHAQPAADADDDDEEEHHVDLTVVGRMKPTGTPWDRAIIVPVEQVWRVHGLPDGHVASDKHLGPPFEPTRLSGVPAIVVKPKNLAGAYGLRSLFKTPESMAFFPAEVLVQLYGVLGGAAALMGGFALAAQALVLLAIVAGIFAILSLSRRQFAVLRVLGAPPAYLVLCVWCYATLIVLVGAVLGAGLGYATAAVASQAIARSTGIAISATIGGREILSVAAMALVGSLLSLIPALVIARRKPLDGLAQS